MSHSVMEILIGRIRIEHLYIGQKFDIPGFYESAHCVYDENFSETQSLLCTKRPYGDPPRTGARKRKKTLTSILP